MSRLYSSALVACLGGTLLATTSLTAEARGIERKYGFQNKKPANAQQERNTRGRRFGFFDIFSNRSSANARNKRKIAASAKTKYVTKNYSYRADRLVVLGDGSLKQPLEKAVPLFGSQAPKNFDPIANLAGSNKLDDSLAQTIFDVLSSANLSQTVTKQQKKSIVNFYKARNFKPLWTEMDGVMSSGKQLLAYFAKADEEGMNSVDYLPASLSGFTASLSEIESDLEAIARFDITLTALAVRYGQHASGGRIIPNRLSGYHDLAPPKVAAGKILSALAKTDRPESYLSKLHPQHNSYQAFKKALAALSTETSEKKFPKLITSGVIKLNRSDQRVGLIRTRLEDAGLLVKASGEDALLTGQRIVYDKEMFEAVKEFQKSKRLSADGIIGGRTFAAFNGRKSVNKRGKLVMNMERMRWLPRNFGNKHVFVNQASFKLQVMSNSRQVWQTRVVVGKPRNQTSFFIDKMKSVVFNPYWGVPQSIIAKEMLPRLQANPGYLDQRGFQVYNSRGRKVSSSSVDWYNYGGSRVPFSVRQPPGSRNALGKIKFLFPNKHAIYLHDTPSKHLFSRSSRAFSHGCVRVKNPLRFAESVLGWSRARIDKKINSGKNGAVKLKQTIPVYLAYFTAWTDQQGKVSYFSDVYGRDKRLDRALNLIRIAAN